MTGHRINNEQSGYHDIGFLFIFYLFGPRLEFVISFQRRGAFSVQLPAGAFMPCYFVTPFFEDIHLTAYRYAMHLDQLTEGDGNGLVDLLVVCLQVISWIVLFKSRQFSFCTCSSLC